MTLRRCRNNECAHFYDKRAHACPECGTEPHAFNKWLRTAQLNNGLYKQAARADAQKRRAA